MRPHLVAVWFGLAVAGGALAQSINPAPGFRVFGQNNGSETWLVDDNANIIHRWPSQYVPGGVYLEPDGTFIRMVRTTIPSPISGGAGGVQRVALDGTLLWDYRYDGPGVLTHHDIEVLPNGNVLMIAWEDKTHEEAIQAGRNPAKIQAGAPFRPDHIIEVQQTGFTTGKIVWSWHVWDHLIQDFDPTKDNYGAVANHPDKVDINYPPDQTPGGGDWNHVNGIDYDPVHDRIVISPRQQNEIWVIDHGPPTTDKASVIGPNGIPRSTGGIVYRWGNPEAYRAGTVADRRLRGQHAPQFIPYEYPGGGNILIFNNLHVFGTSVWEITPPMDADGNYVLGPTGVYGPELPVWLYADPDNFRSAFISSAERLPNGNTLVCSGGQGWVFELGANDEIVWEFRDPSRGIFHAHYYEHYLWADRTRLSGSRGGSVTFDLMAGSRQAGNIYFLLGSTSGTFPGLRLGRNATLPLNVDSYLLASLTYAGIYPFVDTVGFLDSSGRARATLNLPAGLSSVLTGMEFDHAFMVLGPTEVTMASNAVPLRIGR